MTGQEKNKANLPSGTVLSPLLLTSTGFEYQTCIFGVLESRYLTFPSVQWRRWAGRLCVRPRSFVRLVPLLKESVIAAPQADGCQRGENDRRSMGHGGE